MFCWKGGRLQITSQAPRLRSATKHKWERSHCQGRLMGMSGLTCCSQTTQLRRPLSFPELLYCSGSMRTHFPRERACGGIASSPWHGDLLSIFTLWEKAVAEAPGLGVSVPGNPTQAHARGGLAGSPYLIDVQGHKLSGTIVGSWHHLHETHFAGVLFL